MAINRRSLLFAAASLPCFGGGTLSQPRLELFLSARSDLHGRPWLSAIDRLGAVHLNLPLPGRGHAVMQRPRSSHGVLLSRRPGTYAVVFDLKQGRQIRVLATPAGHHFQGHGAFAADGRTFFASENDYDGGRGVVDADDATDGYRRVGAYPSYGIGPHELRLLPDGKTIVVANGGILTHPDSGRAKLNLATMAPSLCYLDQATGRLNDTYRLPPRLHRLSLRHLAVTAAGAVAIGMQYEGARQDQVPLVALHTGGATIEPLAAAAQTWARLRHYCGSVAVDRDGSLLAATSPRGGTALFWDLNSGRLIDELQVPDVCGVAATQQSGEFMVTAGTGHALIVAPQARRYQALNAPILRQSWWDNHLQLMSL